jgi:proteasome accessory factor B
VGKGVAFRFRVRFSPEVSDEVREMVWHPRQKIETDSEGRAILELPAESLREARRFILAYGRHAEALSPPELVEDLRAETEALARTYVAGPRGGRPEASGSRKKPGASRRS